MGTAIQERLRLQADFAQSRGHINSANNCREAANYIDSLEKQRDEAKLKVERQESLLNDKQYIDMRARYDRGELSWCNMINERERDLREADAAIKEAGKL